MVMTLRAPAPRHVPGGANAPMRQATAGVAALGQQFADQLQAEQEKRQSREATVDRVRASAAFKEFAFNEYNRFGAEADMTDPRVSQQYHAALQDKANELMGNHLGDEDSRVRLLTHFEEVTSAQTAQMQTRVHEAQRKMIVGAFDERLGQIGAAVLKGPQPGQDFDGLLSGAFLQGEEALAELMPGLEFEDEMGLRDRMREVIVRNTLEPMLAGAQFEAARNIIEQNPEVIQQLPEAEQRRIVNSIASGIRAKENSRLARMREMQEIKGMADMMGVQVSGAQLFEAATGIDMTPDLTTGQKRAQAMGLNYAGLPTAQQMLLEGIKLPTSGGAQAKAIDIDPNRDRFLDPSTGQSHYTEQGLINALDPAITQARSANVLLSRADAMMAAIQENGSASAGKALIESFQQLIGPGVVMEGDIRALKDGGNALTRVRSWADGLTEGTMISAEQGADIYENVKTLASIMRETSFARAKPLIAQGYSTNRNMQMVIPGDFQNLFANEMNAPTARPKAGLPVANTLTGTPPAPAVPVEAVPASAPAQAQTASAEMPDVDNMSMEELDAWMASAAGGA